VTNRKESGKIVAFFIVLSAILLSLFFISFLLGRYGLTPRETLSIMASKAFPVEIT
jgi:hypothetical protein